MMEADYKFRIVKRGDGYEVQEIVLNYVYGERLGAYGWCNASREPELERYFKSRYLTFKGAKRAITSYRDGLPCQEDCEEILWEEP